MFVQEVVSLQWPQNTRVAAVALRGKNRVLCSLELLDASSYLGPATTEMKFSTVISALTLASWTTASPARRFYPDQLIAVAPTDPKLSELGVNAIDGFFSIGYCPTTHRGGSPTTSCPPSIKDCPAGNVTAVIYSRDQAALDTQVPGGQYIYIDKNGFLAYTAPHAGIIPKNATATGFSIAGPKGDEHRGTFHFKGVTAKGPALDWVACPSADGGPPFTLMARFENFYKTFDRQHECVEVYLALSRYEGSAAAAWQYDVATLQ
ncbi:hypothetical protein K461DRAFT_315317 [Myriangium duriaei CBS 260.36]|uniref:Uncharacterized protein n=1 Tax=Myriangium duriaei CBS 260.36 TaxID=1168546 RepID=A0A9P4MCY1_9PEZI|nr:hypothetical protein K461DRAFT_315317 [Myriangium duriaei CBS 260.36]